MDKKKSWKDSEKLFKDILTEEYLKEEYVNKMISINILTKKHNCSRNVIENFLSKYNILIRSIKESTNTPDCLKRRQQTSFKHYGVSNPSQSDTIKEQKAKTFLKNYGVDNIWKTREYYIWLDSYMMDIYGKKRITDGIKQFITKANFSEEKKKNISQKISIAHKKIWNNLNDTQQKNRMAHMRTFISLDIKSSALEFRIKNILDNFYIDYIHQFFLSYYSYDFSFKNHILLEIQGDYWHANPMFYKPHDEMPYGGTAQNKWEKDYIKKLEAEKYGNKIFYLWESVINHMTDIDILTYIRGINEN